MEESTHSTGPVSSAPELSKELPPFLPQKPQSQPQLHAQPQPLPSSQSQAAPRLISDAQSQCNDRTYSESPSLTPSLTPPSTTANTTPSASSYLTYPVSYAMSGILRRLGSDPVVPSPKPNGSGLSTGGNNISINSSTTSFADYSTSGLYTPPRRQPSPFEPPPLYPLSLKGYKETTKTDARLLSKSLAEEIRLLVPPRLQLVDKWALLYSLEQDGVSLATLYKKCDDYRGRRGGYVVVVRDKGGGTFGAYLSDPPYPAAHFYGTGECFLWRASILPSVPTLASLPPPPSEDTTNLGRMTTIRQSSEMLTPQIKNKNNNNNNNNVSSNGTNGSDYANSSNKSGMSTPDRIRFKAFPYSGINDYMIFCQQGYLSIGGGDGHYGLWLNDNLERGVSNTCLTFGNEELSDDGSKFDILGVEVWYVGAQE